MFAVLQTLTSVTQSCRLSAKGSCGIITSPSKSDSLTFESAIHFQRASIHDWGGIESCPGNHLHPVLVISVHQELIDVGSSCRHKTSLSTSFSCSSPLLAISHSLVEISSGRIGSMIRLSAPGTMSRRCLQSGGKMYL